MSENSKVLQISKLQTVNIRSDGVILAAYGMSTNEIRFFVPNYTRVNAVFQEVLNGFIKDAFFL